MFKIKTILYIFYKTSILFFSKGLILNLSKIFNFHYGKKREIYLYCKNCNIKYIKKLLTDYNNCIVCHKQLIKFKKEDKNGYKRNSK